MCWDKTPRERADDFANWNKWEIKSNELCLNNFDLARTIGPISRDSASKYSTYLFQTILFRKLFQEISILKVYTSPHASFNFEIYILQRERIQKPFITVPSVSGFHLARYNRKTEDERVKCCLLWIRPVTHLYAESLKVLRWSNILSSQRSQNSILSLSIRWK